MKRIIMIMVFSVFCSPLIGGYAFASEAELYQEIALLKAKITQMETLSVRVAELEKRLEAQGCAITTQNTTVAEIKDSLIQYRPGEGVTMPPCGIEITADATWVIQGTPNSNNAGDTEASRTDAAWSADIYIRKTFDDWGLALLHLEPGQGVGVENELSLFSNVNRDQNDTDANVPVTELWYEQYLFNKQIALTGGKLDPANYLDQNIFAHDECTQFLARIFKQNPAIEWPDDNTLGARLIIAPEVVPYLSLEATYFNANNTYEEIFDRPFVSAQLNLKPSELLKLDKGQWDGNYRLYWWLNALNHAKLVGSGENPADKIKEDNYGFGISVDQRLTDTFGVFTRFGWERPDLQLASSNPNAAQCEASWSGGLRMGGKFWNRPEDVVAVGVGQVFPGEHYKAAGVEGTGGAAEGHLELYYKCQIFKWLALTPDFQWVWNPHGVNHGYLGDEDVIFVYGVRGQLDL